MKYDKTEKDELKDINIDRFLDDLNHMRKSKELGNSRKLNYREQDRTNQTSPEMQDRSDNQSRPYSRSPTHFTRRIENLKKDIKYINNKPELKVETQILEKLDNLQLCLKQLENRYESEISALKEEIILLRRKDEETPNDSTPRDIVEKQVKENKVIKVSHSLKGLVKG